LGVLLLGQLLLGQQVAVGEHVLVVVEGRRQRQDGRRARHNEHVIPVGDIGRVNLREVKVGGALVEGVKVAREPVRVQSEARVVAFDHVYGRVVEDLVPLGLGDELVGGRVHHDLSARSWSPRTGRALRGSPTRCQRRRVGCPSLRC
ncbi:hypothetical protein T492DRAFT_1123851, partial [Pavlovales sp. CCMP2436]